MKTLLAASAIAVVTLAGSPASAQDSGGTVFAQAAAQQRTPVVQRRSPALARRLTSPDGRAHSDNPAYDVYDTSGNYISSDPDPAIRNELMRDPPGRSD